MSARIVKGGRKAEPMTLAEFAANLRYSTGEGIYSEDCPALLAAGILRCDEPDEEDAKVGVTRS